uniref:Uncharacterized protein LOC104210575 n=1 Tax=Nicotiana sylvestris TaxID=4096 RepID=A0A1U7V7S3_NICSY|nr:PREDICTED: uncharacterized protein LOC104210575 [Nicotiana sylvestris]
MRPYFSAMPESSYCPLAIQGSSSGYSGHQVSSSSYFSAMPDSSYRPQAIQGSSSGSSGHQGQTSEKQITTSRGCFECGDLSHVRRFYPRDASILFDQGSTYSYVSSLFAHFLDIPRESLGTLIYMSTPVGDSIVVDQIYQSCVVIFSGYMTTMDLLLLDMTDYDVILGMDYYYHIISSLIVMPRRLP